MAICIPLINSEGKHFSGVFFSCNFIFYCTRCLSASFRFQVWQLQAGDWLTWHSVPTVVLPPELLSLWKGVLMELLSANRPAQLRSVGDLATQGQLSINGLWKTVNRCFSPTFLGWMNLHILCTLKCIPVGLSLLPMVVAKSTAHYCTGFSSSPIQSAQLFISVFWVNPLSLIQIIITCTKILFQPLLSRS